MYKNIAPKLKSSIDRNSDSFIKNKEIMLEKIQKLNALLKEAELGGGQCCPVRRFTSQSKIVAASNQGCW